MAYPNITYLLNQAAMLNQPWATVGDLTYREDLDQTFSLIALPSNLLFNWSPTTGGGGGGFGNFSNGETIAFSGKGGTTFLTPNGVFFQLFQNGLLLTSGVDYTRVGTTLTLAIAALAGVDTFAAYYSY